MHTFWMSCCVSIPLDTAIVDFHLWRNQLVCPSWIQQGRRWLGSRELTSHRMVSSMRNGGFRCLEDPELLSIIVNTLLSDLSHRLGMVSELERAYKMICSNGSILQTSTATPQRQELVELFTPLSAPSNTGFLPNPWWCHRRISWGQVGKERDKETWESQICL